MKSIKYIQNIINFDRTSQSSSDRIRQNSSVEINNFFCIFYNLYTFIIQFVLI